MLSLLSTLLLLTAGAALLLLGADWFLDGAGELARALGMSALVLGIILVGLEPEEMLTAAIASARGVPALAVGNVIGTNVTIVTAALGLSAVLSPLTLSRRMRRQALIATAVSLLPVLLLFTGNVTREEGVLLLAVFAGYTALLVRTDRAAILQAADADDEGEREGRTVPEGRPVLWKAALLTSGGLAAMAAGGPALVEGALHLAEMGLPGQGVVGATVVALGTGAEMIALGISAARRRQAEVLIGGILGSLAYNLLVTLGLAAAIHGLPVEPRMTLFALPTMIGAHLVLLALIWYGKVPRLAGGLLIVVYLAYLFVVILL
jgi:cation:H+ antiporter